MLNNAKKHLFQKLSHKEKQAEVFFRPILFPLPSPIFCEAYTVTSGRVVFVTAMF
jgi:hypothetical protein